jgi:hypothetical protein
MLSSARSNAVVATRESDQAKQKMEADAGEPRTLLLGVLCSGSEE